MISEILQYYATNGNLVLEQFLRHFLISIYGVLFASIVAIPLGFKIARHRKLAPWVIRIGNVIQTIPSLAMLSILMIVMGLGPNTVVMTVFLYSLLPIVKNTYTAVLNVQPQLLDVAKGMGMTSRQILLKVELPLSMSIIIGGIRNALVLAIGITAIGTFIGAGGLGDIITRGINVSNGSAIVWAGALPTALMAILADVSLSYLEKKLIKV
ncbi:ABC transporter permease [Erysipelothrix inopinata]|uniref:ABC transporter permease n=1 Tax=Erysipelothrix inopinata TaxID=225084 RepID=A0A7G9RWJ9_9FIRM|nr:ABC transporter permease [Erysipelothrix inopinata]QNN59974.1 ABC transporter permease [Erysipelothrix inopinata]